MHAATHKGEKNLFDTHARDIKQYITWYLS